MSISALRRVSLPPVPAPVYETCWNLLGLGVMPFPLVVLGHSADDAAERTSGWLNEHGLSGGSDAHVGPELAAALRVIADFDDELAVVYADEPGQTGVGCFIRGADGLRAVLRGNAVELSWIDPARAAESAMAVIPPRAAALVPGPRSAADDSGDGAGNAEFLAVYSTATAFGRATTVSRTPDRTGTRVSEVPVTWLDTPAGRYSITTADGQLTLAPVGPAALLEQLRGLFA
ncbi:ESX secretion-associated protein EspG [Allokutzneria sp. A3M-2-11 16]|uniref:ESX secretion-associated protein EspG n=1 Tax=Allokutzneria sp. A3M-2-11 16 TaxID=2962043 RepID=UPI0020B68498|nr:ESX secretion-associated protein EspG [Allokutzneria sp. A3M-2-11 16]MCP3798964.1 ESX secretion-associated protein EspG [Allokutzneria sp. A3M-2-11 16]